MRGEHVWGCGLLAVWACGIGLAGCGDESTCSASSAEPQVFVIDADTEQPLCNAEVELSEGDFRQVITYQGDVAACSGLYSLPAREGTYTTFVSASSDYAITATQITLKAGGCGGISAENAGPQSGLPGRANAVTVTLRKL